MKESMRRTMVIIGGMTLVLRAGVASAGVPLYDGFESYSVGTSLNGTNGWGVANGSAIVQTNVVWANVLGTNAMAVMPVAVASNLVGSAQKTNVWFEFYLTNSLSMPVSDIGPEGVNSNMAVQCFIETNGYPVVWDPVTNGWAGAWLVCSNDYWGTNTAVYNTNAWMQLTVCANYSNHTAAVFLNQHLLMQKVRFCDTSLDQSDWFQMDGCSSRTSYLDEVSARYAPANLALDLDHDGLPDWQEIQTYGNVDTARRLWITAAQTNMTDGGAGGGWLDSPADNPFEVAWTNVSTNLHWSASNGFYAAVLYTNGVSAGIDFNGRQTNYAAWTWINNQADATVRVAFARMPVITASNSIYGSTMPASTNAYPGNARKFDFSATNTHYYVSGILTNGQLLSTNDFTGWGSSAGEFVWQNIQTNGGIEVLYAHKFTNSMSVVYVGGPGPGGSMAVSTNEVFPGESLTFSLTSSPAYVVAALTNNGALVTTFGGQPAVTNYVFTNIQTNLNVQGVFSYTARRFVPQDYQTITDAMANARSGEAVIVVDGSYTNDVTISNGVSLQGTNFTVVGNVVVNTGATGTLVSCSSLVVTGATVNGLLVISNGVVNIGALTISSGATVQVANAATLIANGVTITGPFVLDTTFGTVVAPAARALPFNDGFEGYPQDAIMATMGVFGWGTTNTGIKVETNTVAEGTKAVLMPAGAVMSNYLASSALPSIWAEWRCRGPIEIDESMVHLAGPDTNLTVFLFVNTNGHVTMYDPDLSVFNVLSNDFFGNQSVKLTPADWARITVNMNFQTKKAAVFLNGRLLKQSLRFINTNKNYCAGLQWDSAPASPAYLDSVNIWTNVDPVVSDDADHDGISDAVEINNYGDVLTWPRGAVFKIR